MQTHCVRQGQVEVGIIEHEGREFEALGASVVGRSITGYTQLVDGESNSTSFSPALLNSASSLRSSGQGILPGSSSSLQ